MICPSCTDAPLSPAKLETSLPVMQCKKCYGALLSIIAYRDWSERTVFSENAESATIEVEKDSKSVLGCPKCSRIMTKYRISGDKENRLDFCVSCGEAWVDKGEWVLLKSLSLAKDLPSIFSEKWQKNIRTQISFKQQFERLEKTIGDENVQKLKDTEIWLDDNEHKMQILQYLNSYD